MQLQKLFALSSLVLLGNVVGTLADLEPDEVPKQCQQVCQSVVQRSQQCDKNTQDDHAEKECMCKLKDASTVVPQCEACVAKYHSEVSDHSNPHDNGMKLWFPRLTFSPSSHLTIIANAWLDVHDIIQFCHFSTTTYTGGGMPATATDSTASATESSGTTATGAMASTSTMTSSGKKNTNLQ